MPSDAKQISCKLIYKIKTRTDGSVERYRALPVARGFSQEYGIDYEVTFAPVSALLLILLQLINGHYFKWMLRMHF